MTNEEPTVQVPVSLIERITLDGYTDKEERELLALLSQPTAEPCSIKRGFVTEEVYCAVHGRAAGWPCKVTAEPDAWEQAAQIAERDAVGVTLSDLTQFPTVQATGARIAFNIRAAAQKNGSQPNPTAEPPRIEDMAPGTTFTGTTRQGFTQRFERVSRGRVKAENGTLWSPLDYQGRERIDPSTIRDVTPPKEA